MAALASLAVLPSRATSSGELDRAAYHTALDGVTKYGLSWAVRSILRGGLKHGFLPSPPELRMQCDKAMEPHLEMKRVIDRAERMKREQAAFDAELDAAHAAKTPEAKRRAQQVYRQFLAAQEQIRADEEAAERAEIRSRYGMTPDVLAGIKDAEFANARMGSAVKAEKS